MNRNDSRGWIVKGIALVLSGLTIVACASANKAALRQASVESSKSLAVGDYGKAIELCRKLYEKDRTNGRIVSSCAAMIERVKAAGDTARSKGSWAAAQSAYRVLAVNWDWFSSLAPRLTFKRADLDAGLKDCRLGLCERQFRQEIEAGNHVKAIAIFQSALKDCRDDKAVKARYAKGIAEIWKMGAQALAAKDYALAGRIDGLLLKNLESFEGVVATAAGGGSSKEALTEALRACSTELTNAGLAEYRKGNLENAIAYWDDLLAFDPGNAEIKKAVETAKVQLGKLKRSSKGGSNGGRGGQGIRGAR
jgi:tetratricopeptide (TPR) repeat protein